MSVDHLPAALADITAVFAGVWRVEYKLGTFGHRYLTWQNGKVVADTGWHDAFIDAAKAHAAQFVLLSAQGPDRFRTADD